VEVCLGDMPINDTDTTSDHHQQQQTAVAPPATPQHKLSFVSRRKHSKTTDDVLTSSSVVEVEISEVERQKIAEKDTIGHQLLQLDRPLLTRSKSLDEVEMAHNRMNPPTTLATVLENMPLIYNTATKRLERASDALSLRQDRPLVSSCEHTGTVDEQKTPKPFKRGHIRHSSYESSQIQLLPTPVAPPFVGRTNSLNRCVRDQ
jgi:hypothetical protein